MTSGDETNSTRSKTEYHEIDIGSPASRALLEKAYYTLYVPAFPVEDERDSLDLWLDCYREGKELIIIIAGNNLSDPDQCDLKAVAVAYYLPAANAGWMCYNVIDPKCRRQGLGKKMVALRMEAMKTRAQARGHAQLDGAFMEMEDPHQADPGKSSVDPVARLALYTKMGAKILPVNYVQPETRAGGQRCRNLLLLAYPVDGQYPGPAATGRFIEALYRDGNESLKRAADLAADPDFRAMSAQIAQWQAAEESPFEGAQESQAA